MASTEAGRDLSVNYSDNNESDSLPLPPLSFFLISNDLVNSLEGDLAHVVRVGCHCEIKFWPACSNWQRQDPAEVTHKQTDRHTHTQNQHSLVPVIENDWKKASRWNEVSKCLQGWTLLHDNTCRRGGEEREDDAKNEHTLASILKVLVGLAYYSLSNKQNN